MTMTLDLQLKQGLTLSPQLQQALRLLQLSALEFAQEVAEAAINNPFLEDVSDTRDQANGAEARAHAAPTTVAEPQSASPQDEMDIEPSRPSGDAFDRFGSAASDHDGDWTEWRAAGVGLHDHLHEQLKLSQLGEREATLAYVVVESLDDDGYLKMPLADILDTLPAHEAVTEEELRTALRYVQTLEPCGVGARNLSECLALQLRDQALDHDEAGDDSVRAIARRIVTNEIETLAAHDFEALRKRLGVSAGAVADAVALIRSLDPKPGDRFDTDDLRYVVPDVFVNKVRGTWVVTSNAAVAPRLEINRAYVNAMAASEDPNSMARQLQEARWLLRSMAHRCQTIQRVAEAIVRRQGAFLEYGELAMKPLVLRQIADELNLHESTVCRVTNNKYMATPRGLFEFKHFFSRQLGTQTGGTCSAKAVRALLKELIGSEDPVRPLSDSMLAKLLAEQGVRVARRTVTKYRTAMRLPSVDARRARARAEAARSVTT